MNNQNVFSLALEELDDTLILSPENENVLLYNSQVKVWENQPFNQTTEDGKTILGKDSGENISGDSNISIGWQNSASLTTGDLNICIGDDANILAGDSNNVVVGHNASSNNYDGCIVLGNFATGREDGTLALGSTAHPIKIDPTTPYNTSAGNLIIWINGHRYAIPVKIAE